LQSFHSLNLKKLISSSKKLQLKNFLYRIYFSHLVLPQTPFYNIFSYTLFSMLNCSNYILNNENFFIFLYNNRVKYALKHTFFYRRTASFNIKTTKASMFYNFTVGFISTWVSLRNWILPGLLAVISLFYLSFLRLSFFTIFLFKCVVLFGVFYWLFSGFTFFMKKYRYRYFTSSVQRFWKRCFAIFWLLEFFVFFVYFYLTFMASQEPFLMYDNAQIFKTHLFSWKLFLLKIFPSTTLIIFTYFLTFSIKWTSTSKLDLFIMVITFLLFYLFWLEFYQFFHIISYYGNYVWKISDDLTYWYLEGEFKKTRINNHFISICLVAKFWHIVFTLVFWLFFILRNLEGYRIRLPLLGSNLQNFIFIYALTWLYMFPWVKYTFLRLLNVPYYWFFVNTKKQVLYIFCNDFYYIAYQLFSDVLYLPYTIIKQLSCSTVYYDFFNYHTSSNSSSFSQYKRNYIRDYFIIKVSSNS